MERFDYNPLPDALIKDFVKAANAKDKLTVEELAALMKEKMVPTMKGILEGAMPERGGELVSEEMKQRFMATKAKELGITLEEIDKIMKSAYIYVPVLTDYERKQGKDDKDKYTYTIKGGIIWFHVNLSGDEPAVNLRVSNSTVSSGFGSDDFAWKSAVKNFTRNLQVATRDIAEFKLSAAISEVDNGDIAFKLGAKEGIKMDHCFLVGEWVSYSDGLEFEKTGWVRIGKVGNNKTDKTAKSSAWAVKKGSWGPGMTVVEHPRLGIDIAVKAGVFQTKITEGKIPTFGANLIIDEDYDTYAPGLDLDAQYNLAPAVGISQFFFLVGINYTSLTGLEFKSSNPTLTALTTTQPYAWGLHGGFLKKIYMGQMALSIGAKGGIKFFSVIQEFTIGNTEYKYTINNSSVGGQLELGLDYAFTPDLNFGIMAGYRFYSPSESWTLELEPDIASGYVWDDQFPDIDHSGLAFGIYFHYTPPSLPFDPIDFIRGASGK